ncbi:GntR family transcriptional regulator (plasmid) [Arthrobacter sp. NicSoilE8]|nr:GntR family transcriptional regulator [Arthrobacter sp. NicSoilE8]
MTETPTKFVSKRSAAGIAPRQRLEDEAYNAIKRMIISNELTGGQVISVAALADHLGVSRSPVSKAVILLEQDGFIESEPYKAPRVAAITAKFVRDVYVLRTVLEARAAAEAVLFLTPEDISSLTEALATLRTAHDNGDTVGVAEIDKRLHRLFAARSDNKLLSGFLDNLEFHLVRIRNVYSRLIFSGPETDIQSSELIRIVEAAIARNAGEAEAAMRDHVSLHAQRLIQQIEESKKE